MPPSESRVIAALVSAGLSGTIAVTGAVLARLDLFAQFRWSALDDFSTALSLVSALVLLEAALLGPRWDVLLAGSGWPGAKAGAVGLQLRTERVGELLSADSAAAMLVLHQACFVAAQVVRGRGGLPPPPLSGPDGTPLQQPAAAPAAAGALTEAGLVMVRETSKELLQRGLIFTFLAAWITDRAFEAGADDVLALPPALAAAAAALGVGVSGAEIYMTDAVRLGTAAALTAALLPSALNEAEALRLGVASNLALVTVEQQEQQQRAARQAAAQAQGQKGAEEEKAEKAATLSGVAGARDGTGTAGAAVASATGEAEAEAAADGGYDEGLDDEETEGLLREYRLVEALGRSTSFGPPRLTYALTLLRGGLRFGSANLAFALTGNLAASLLASALPNLLLLAYVRMGPKVLLERPAAVAPATPGEHPDCQDGSE